MAKLLLKCPVKQKLFQTSVDADEIPDDPEKRTYSQCPLCGQVHSWTLQDAIKPEDPGPGKA